MIIGQQQPANNSPGLINAFSGVSSILDHQQDFSCMHSLLNIY